MTVPNNANTYLPPTIAIPSALEISNITRSYPMVVTVTANSDQVNTYHERQVVKLFVPMPFKMFQANGLQGQILSVDDDEITLDIDSTHFDTFVVPSEQVFQPASLSPAGSRNLQYDNTSRQIPFQSLNNVGN